MQRIHLADETSVLSLAGLYELWPDPAKADDDPDRWLWTAVIITTEGTGPFGEVHDRTPLILPADRVDAWLDPTLTDPGKIQRMLTNIEVDDLVRGCPARRWFLVAVVIVRRRSRAHCGSWC